MNGTLTKTKTIHWLHFVKAINNITGNKKCPSFLKKKKKAKKHIFPHKSKRAKQKTESQIKHLNRTRGSMYFQKAPENKFLPIIKLRSFPKVICFHALSVYLTALKRRGQSFLIKPLTTTDQSSRYFRVIMYFFWEDLLSIFMSATEKDQYA